MFGLPAPERVHYFEQEISFSTIDGVKDTATRIVTLFCGPIGTEIIKSYLKSNFLFSLTVSILLENSFGLFGYAYRNAKFITKTRKMLFLLKLTLYNATSVQTGPIRKHLQTIQ